MMAICRDRLFRAAVICGSFFLFALLAIGVHADEGAPPMTALDKYIAKPDDSYAWKLASTIPGEGCTTYVIDLKSQSWRTAEEVDRTLWEHWLTIVKPDRVTSSTAMLFIGGGGKKTTPPEKPGDLTRQLALGTGSIVAELSMVPNQPLEFHQDGKPRVEDDLIAYTWMKLMMTGDLTWTTRMPMVKSAVPHHGRRARVSSERRRGQAADRWFRRRWRLETRLDDVAHRRRRQSRRGHRTDRDRRP